LRQKKLRGHARTQTQVAISTGKNWVLLDASPDLRLQIENERELTPRSENAVIRSSPIAAVILTSAEIDRVMGLLHLREFQPLQIFATESVRRVLTEDNTLFRALHREPQQASWETIVPEREFATESLNICGFSLKSSYPEFVSAGRAAELKDNEALLALEIRNSSSGKKMIYAPSLPALDNTLRARLAACDLLFLDGTFWQNDELMKVRGAGRTAREMGHIAISGKDGTLELLTSSQRPKKIFIHINNTNPVLDEASAESKAVRTAGWTVAKDGMEFEL
jgi:pyrroloquinoline quinone biosynthesis protein B